MVDVDEFVHHVFRAKGARRTADEFGDLCERIGPKHGIQRRSVDAADNAAQLIFFAHVTYRTSGFLGNGEQFVPCFWGTIIAVSADTTLGRSAGLGRTASGVSLMNLQRDRR
ncbi:MAG TPA: hypothetical protein VK577_25780 [Bradyrhizobium sp.]|nr:hypothetical protein [Bradyrhizobium sp.]